MPSILRAGTRNKGPVRVTFSGQKLSPDDEPDEGSEDSLRRKRKLRLQWDFHVFFTRHGATLIKNKRPSHALYYYHVAPENCAVPEGPARPAAYAIQINYPFAKAYNLLQNQSTQANIDTSVDKGLPPSINDFGRYNGWRRKGQENMAYQGTQPQAGGFTATEENLQTLPEEKQVNPIKRTRPARRSSGRLKAAAMKEAENQKLGREQSADLRTFEQRVAAITPNMTEPPTLEEQIPAAAQAKANVAATERTESATAPAVHVGKVLAELAAQTTYTFEPTAVEDPLTEPLSQSNEKQPANAANWYEAKTIDEFIPSARAHARKQLGLQPEDGSIDEDESSELFLNSLGAKLATDLQEYSPEKQRSFFKKFRINATDQETVLQKGGRARQIVTDALIVWEKNQLKLPKRVSYSEIENAMHAKNFELLSDCENKPETPEV